MKLSKREKTLLTILLTVAAVFVFYSYMLTPQMNKLAELKLRLAEQEQNREYVQIQMSPNNKVYSDYKAFNASIELMTQKLFPYIIQEKIILYVEDMLKSSGVQASTIAYSQPSLKQPGDEVEAIKTEIDPEIKRILDEITGKKNEEEKKSEEKSAEGGYTLEHMSVTMNIQGTYESITRLLNKIEYFDKKILISSLNLVAAENTLAGIIVLDFYAVPKLKILNDSYLEWESLFEKGKDNPFIAFEGYVAAVNTPSTDASGQENATGAVQPVSDFLLVARPFSSDLPTVILGDAKDKSNKSYIYADSPNHVDIEVQVIKSEGKYFYRYKTNNSSYPTNYEEASEFKPAGGAIEFKILSYKRNAKEDVNGVNLTIINNTDLAVNVYIENDDTARPRVNIAKLQGNIKVKK